MGFSFVLGRIRRGTWLAFVATSLLFAGCWGKKKSLHGDSINGSVPVDPAFGDALPALHIKLPQELRSNKPLSVEAVAPSAVSWQWQMLKGPGQLRFQPADQAATQISADTDGVYEIRLTVSSADGRTFTASTTLSWDTKAPEIWMSEDFASFQESIIEAKVASDAIFVEWTQLEGPGLVRFADAKAARTSLSANQDGEYRLRLTAYDDLGNAEAKEILWTWDTLRPQVQLGPDRVSSVELLLDASSRDAASFQWTQISGPGQIRFSSPLSEDTRVSADKDGIYRLRLTVQRNSGAVENDEILLTWDTQAPLISLISETQARFRTTLDAKVEGALQYQWSQLSGPSPAKFSHASSEDSAITVTSSGDYEFALSASDAAGNVSSARVRVSFIFDLNVYAQQLSTGAAHACAVFEDGSAGCWGYNFDGELGFGDTLDRAAAYPFGINFGSAQAVQAIVAGYSHSCAILKDKSLRCWGSNSFGELGYGDSKIRLAPSLAPVPLLGQSVSAIALGQNHSCAIFSTGQASCWGANSDGQLGLGDRLAKSAFNGQTLAFGEGRKVLDIKLGAYHSCALLDDGSVSCWGSNAYGQLGRGDLMPRLAPGPGRIAFPGEAKAKSIAVGAYHSCAILNDESLRCWGRNTEAQLGLGDRISRSLPSTEALAGLGAVSSVSAGLQHSCALTKDQRVLCWGQNDEAQLGLEGLAESLVPTNSFNLDEINSPALSLVSGEKYNCLHFADKTLRCFGSNSYGQLGDGSVLSRAGLKNLVNQYGEKAARLFGFYLSPEP